MTHNRKSMVASNEDIAGTHESMGGEWDEWMCMKCGIFMKATAPVAIAAG